MTTTMSKAHEEKKSVGLLEILNGPYVRNKDKPDDKMFIQQDDNKKEFYMEIVNGSLKTAFNKYGIARHKKGNKTEYKTKSVIVVGAGLSGLVAAYELQKVGYTVSILERQSRVGGRTKTLREGFSDGLHAEGGAMRIPPNHYLTLGYINKFKIPMREFVNYNEERFLYLQGHKQITLKDWKDKNDKYSNKFFPGWNSRHDGSNFNAKGILDLYDKTFTPVKNDLQTLINEEGEQKGWEEWIKKWSQISVDTFLRTNIYPEISPLYRPWPEAAIRGYQISTYTPQFGTSLVEYLRDELGGWWQEFLKTPIDGMDSLAKHFLDSGLAKSISFGVKVKSIKRDSTSKTKVKVKVHGQNVFTKMDTEFDLAHAVIVTVPLTILRFIDIDLNDDQRRAIADINYDAATKIVLQCRTRFWENKDRKGGGFSKTDYPIGQLHYPSPKDPPAPNERGLLVCYTWGQDALVFGAKTVENAIEQAVSEVAKIHPEITKQFEVGMVQAWFSDETAQGAYASLKPFQYIDNLKKMMQPDHPIYLAGEAISYTNGWMQGAIESGLNAAYNLYCHDNGV